MIGLYLLEALILTAIKHMTPQIYDQLMKERKRTATLTSKWKTIYFWVPKLPCNYLTSVKTPISLLHVHFKFGGPQSGAAPPHLPRDYTGS